jgi:putative transposase
MSAHGSQPGDLPKPPILRREHVSYVSAQVRRQVQAEAAGKACWQSRPHEGLSHTWGEGRDLSPNEMYAACVGISGYVPLPLKGDYIELLPAAFRTVNDYGLTIDNRTYDCKALNPYRRLDSGLPGRNRKKWEVH